MEKHRYIFIGGLHRSGTWLQTQCLEAHPKISRLAQFDESGSKGRLHNYEGQFLQNVYPTDEYYGGVGCLGFHPEAHLTEESNLVTAKNRERLDSEWSRYWDKSKPYLLEKTPANMVRSRFLQAMFPESDFIFVMRHPVAVALAQQKWTGTSVMSLIEHWLVCYEMLLEDTKHLNHFMSVRYEDFVNKPDDEIARIYSFLGLEAAPHTKNVRSNGNDRYFDIWEKACQVETNPRSISRRIIMRLMPLAVRNGYPLTILENEAKTVIQRFETRANAFGYSLSNVRTVQSGIL